MPPQTKQKRHLAAIRANRRAKGWIPKRPLNSNTEDPVPANEQDPKPAEAALCDLEGDSLRGGETEAEHEHFGVGGVEERLVPERAGSRLPVSRLEGGPPTQAFDGVACYYARGPTAPKRTQLRGRREQKERSRAAAGCRPLTEGFLIRASKSELNAAATVAAADTTAAGAIPGSASGKSQDSNNAQRVDKQVVSTTLVGTESPPEIDRQTREAAALALKKKIASKRAKLDGENLTRHRAVLAFLYVQGSKQPGETRQAMARNVSWCFGRGEYFARKIVVWERTWIEERTIEEGHGDGFGKTGSELEDEERGLGEIGLEA